MAFKEIKNAIGDIVPIAHGFFPKNQIPAMPYVVAILEEQDGIYADGKTLSPCNYWRIQLFTSTGDDKLKKRIVQAIEKVDNFSPPLVYEVADKKEACLYTFFEFTEIEKE